MNDITAESSAGIRTLLDGFRVKLHRVESPLLGRELYFRDPSGTDYITIARLRSAVVGDRKDTDLPGWLVVPLLLCDQEGKLVFPDFEDGVSYFKSLSAEALREVTQLCLQATGLGEATVENAEKKS